MKKLNTMKKSLLAIGVSVLTLPLLVGCFDKNELPDVDSSNNDNNSSDNIENESYIHSIYELAVRSGYSGSFDKWKSEIKGEKGDRGSSIESIEFKEIKNNEQIYSITLDSGFNYEVAIKMPDSGFNGNEGLQGEKGPSTYEQYVNNYGYVGNKEDFYKDFTNHTLGIKKEYKVNTYLVNYDDLMSGYNPEVEYHTVFENNTYKNGEKINFELPDLGKHYFICAACDKVADENLHYKYEEVMPGLSLNSLHDYKDYRAYCDTNIILYYSYSRLFMKTQNIDYREGLKIDFGYNLQPEYTYDNDEGIKFFTDDEYKNLKGYISEKPQSMELTYDDKTRTLHSNKPGSCKLNVVFDNEIKKFDITFYDKNSENKYPNQTPSIEIYEGIINKLTNIEVGEILKINARTNYISPLYRVNNDVCTIYQDEYSNDFYISANKAGITRLEIFDKYSNVLYKSYDIKVYKKGEAPLFEKINDLKVNGYCYDNLSCSFNINNIYNEKLELGMIKIYDESNNKPINDYTIDNYDNYSFKITFKKEGTYKIVIENQYQYGETILNVVEKN